MTSIDENTASTEKVLDSQFGQIIYTPSEVLIFPEGIVGYEEQRSYLLYDQVKYRPFGWLISIDKPELMFPVILASDLLPDYNPLIPDMSGDDAVFLIVAIGGSTENVTVNLRAPLLIAKTERSGRQIILADSKYSLRHPLTSQV
ncbi:flagellar assembly protein FliW [bacterium]|nr:flagellar assembly protein FliW [bacterium]